MYKAIATMLLMIGCYAYCSAQPLPAPRYSTPEQRQARSERMMAEAAKYGANIIRLFPLRSLDNTIGFGIDYEHLFGEKRNLGLVLPFSYGITGDNSPYRNTPLFANSSSFFYFSPGLKIYPFGQRKVTYAVGPSLILGYGKDYANFYSSQGLATPNRIRMGIIANNYLNVQFSRNINFGVELGWGVRYLDHGINTSTDISTAQITGNFAVSFGYRF